MLLREFHDHMVGVPELLLNRKDVVDPVHPVFKERLIVGDMAAHIVVSAD